MREGMAMTRGEGDYAFRFTGERVDVRDLPTRLDDIDVELPHQKALPENAAGSLQRVL